MVEWREYDEETGQSFSTGWHDQDREPPVPKICTGCGSTISSDRICAICFPPPSLAVKTVTVQDDGKPAVVSEYVFYGFCSCCGKHKEMTIKSDGSPVPLPENIICDGCKYPPKQNGYHISDIKKGEYAEASKIREETAEFMDAVDQEAKIMALHELSDLYGAMRAYLEKYYAGFDMKDLEKMSDITKRAFESGHRRVEKM